MKLHYMTYDALTELKANLGTLYTNYRKPDNGWITEYFKETSPFGEIKTEFPEFRLNCTVDPANQIKIDLENVRALYTGLQSLTNVQAMDERIWAGLCNCDFYDYAYARWENSKEEKLTEDIIGNRYFYWQNKHRAIMLNSLSKLWWLGRYVYDPDRKDHFELLSYFEEDLATKTLVMFSNNFMSNPIISRGVISALIELKYERFTLPGKTREVYYEATRYLNIYGGTHILDYYTEEEIKQLVLNHLKSMSGASYTPVLITDIQENEQWSDDYFGFEELLNDDVPETAPVSEVREPKLEQFTEPEAAESEPEPEAGQRTNDGREGQLTLDLPEADVCRVLEARGFEVIDNRQKTGLVWVVYNREKSAELLEILNGYNLNCKLDRRGAIATGNRPAWCLLQK